jgi:hypothetical protein
MQPPGKAGDACAKDRDCADGLVCGRDATCHVPGKADEPCHIDPECGDGLACVGASGTVAGTCRALPHVGEICPDQRCARRTCAATTRACTGALPSACPATPCPTSTECALGSECDTATHQCRAFPSLGMPCDGVCQDDSFCLIPDGGGAGTCAALLANDMPCDGNQQCVSGFCEDGAVFRACIDAYVCF